MDTNIQFCEHILPNSTFGKNNEQKPLNMSVNCDLISDRAESY